MNIPFLCHCLSRRWSNHKTSLWLFPVVHWQVIFNQCSIPWMNSWLQCHCLVIDVIITNWVYGWWPCLLIEILLVSSSVHMFHNQPYLRYPLLSQLLMTVGTSALSLLLNTCRCIYYMQNNTERIMGFYWGFFYLLKSFNPSVHGMEFFATPLKIYLKLFQLIRMQCLDISSPEILIPFFWRWRGVLRLWILVDWSYMGLKTLVHCIHRCTHSISC